MTAQVRIADQPWADRIGIYLLRDQAGMRLIDRPGTAAEPVDPARDPGASLVLDDDMAVALLDALATHYRRATDTTHLRADYDAERARVDQLTAALIDAHAGTRETVRRLTALGTPDSASWSPS